MPNYLKYSTSTQSQALKIGNYWIGTGEIKKGPTSVTDYWNGISPPIGGYTIYGNKTSGGPAIHVAANDTELISLTNIIGTQSFTTVEQCLSWFKTQSDKMVFNREYEPIVTNDLVLNLDAGFASSYPITGTTWYDLSGYGNNGTLTNGPTYSSENAGSIVFDGVNDNISLTSPSSTTSWSINFWFEASNLNPSLISGQNIIAIAPSGGSGAEGFINFSMTLFYNVNSINVNSLGEIYVGGQFGGAQSTQRYTCVKFSSSGVLDPSFSLSLGPGGVLSASFEAFVFDSSGGVYFSGTNLGSMGVRRVNSSTGAFISQPLASAGGLTSITAGGVLLDEAAGKLWLFGHSSTSYTGVARQHITKVNSSDYSLDTTFDSASGFSTNEVNTAFLDINKDLYLAGNFTQYRGATASRIVKLNGITAATDATFSTGTGFNAIVNKIALQSDGKIIAAGNFTNYNGTAINRIVRLNTNGSIDGTFSVGTGFNLVVNTLDIQSDGKIIVVGNFTNYNGTNINRIVRLNTDGSIDGTFSVGTGFNFVPTALKIQSDGKVLVGVGATFTYNGSSSYNGLIRLDSNGSIDSTFTIGSGINIPLFRDDNQWRLAGGVVQILPGPGRVLGDTLFPSYTKDRMYTLTFDSISKTLSKYLNASLISTVATTSGLGLTIRPTIISPSGKMSSFSLYSRVLSQEEVIQNYQATFPRFLGQNIVTSGLVFYVDAGYSPSYPTSGLTWYDVSGYGNNGTLTNGATYNSANGGSIVFDGVDDYITLPINSTFNTPSVTYEVWANLQTINDRHILYVNWQGNSLEVNSNRSVVMFNFSSGGQLGANTAANVFNWDSWTHFLGTYNASSQTLKTYVNGVLLATRINTPSTIYAVSTHQISGIQFGGEVKGNISIVRQYNRELTQAEITQNYNAQKSRFGL